MSDTIEKKILIKMVYEDSQAKRSMAESSSVSGDVAKGFLKANVALGALKAGFGLATSAIQGMIKGGKVAIATFIDLSKRGGVVQDVSSGFTKNFKNSTGALNDLRKASNGTISNFDLMQTASKAAMLGVSSDSKQLAKLLSIASGRAQALGIDTTSAFNDIVTGIGRNSPLILDNLGITTQAYNKQVEALEKKGKVLTDAQKKQLLLNTVMKDSITPVVTATDNVENYRTIWQNLRDDIALKVAPIFQKISGEVIPFLIEAIASGRKALTEWWIENKDFVMKQVDRLKVGFSSLRDNIKGILSPTQDSKRAMSDFLKVGIEGVVTALVGKGKDPGLLDLIGKLSNKFKDRDNIEAMKYTLKDISQIISAINKSLGWLIENWDKLMKISRGISAVGTLGISELFRNGGALNKKAIGGMTEGRTLIGETGRPEILELPRGSRVTNPDETERIIQSENRNITINYNTTSTVDINRVASQLAFLLR